jgi:hypothetical protein
MFLEETLGSRIVTMQSLGFESMLCFSWGTVKEFVSNPYSMQGLKDIIGRGIGLPDI